MGETAFHRRGHAAHPSTTEHGRVARRGSVRPRADDVVAAWSSLGVCVVGTHDAVAAAAAWNALVARRHASPERRADGELDASAWWHAQRRWGRFGARGWELVRDPVDGTVPAMLLLGVYRD